MWNDQSVSYHPVSRLPVDSYKYSTFSISDNFLSVLEPNMGPGPAFQPPLVFKTVKTPLSLLSVQYTEMAKFEGVLWPAKKGSQSVNIKFK